MWTHVCAHVCIWRPRAEVRHPPQSLPPYFWRQGLSLMLIGWARLAGQRAPGICLSLVLAGFQTFSARLFSECQGHNVGSHTCTASSAPTEPPPHSLQYWAKFQVTTIHSKYSESQVQSPWWLGSHPELVPQTVYAWHSFQLRAVEDLARTTSGPALVLRAGCAATQDDGRP